MPQPSANKGPFRRWWEKLTRRKRYGDWVAEYNHEAAPVKDDLMDLNNTRR
jgi:hypothetical protein